MPHTHRKYRAALKEALDRFTHLSDSSLKKCIDGVPIILATCKKDELIVRGNIKIGKGLYFNIQLKTSESYPMLLKSFNLTEASYRGVEMEICRSLTTEFLTQMLWNAEIVDYFGYKSDGFNSFYREFNDGRRIVESIHDMKQIVISIEGGKEIIPVVIAFKDRESLKKCIFDFEMKNLCLESISTMNHVLKDLVIRKEKP